MSTGVPQRGPLAQSRFLRRVRAIRWNPAPWRFAIALLLAAPGALLTGCEDFGPSNLDLFAGCTGPFVSVVPNGLSLAVGGSAEVRVDAWFNCPDGISPVQSPRATWSSNAPAVARVEVSNPETTARVVGVAPGAATITATFQDKPATTVVTVTP